MCDPMTATAAVGMTVGLIGSGVKAFGDSQQLGAKATADQQNQRIAEIQAADALQRGAYHAGQIRMRAGQIVGQQRAAYGASGVDANTGSAARVQVATRAMGELDAQTAQNNAARQAWGYNVTAQQYGEQAGLDRQAQGQAATGALLGGIGQAAGGAGSLYRSAHGSLLGGYGMGGY